MINNQGNKGVMGTDIRDDGDKSGGDERESETKGKRAKGQSRIVGGTESGRDPKGRAEFRRQPADEAELQRESSVDHHGRKPGGVQHSNEGGATEPERKRSGDGAEYGPESGAHGS